MCSLLSLIHIFHIQVKGLRHPVGIRDMLRHKRRMEIGQDRHIFRAVVCQIGPVAVSYTHLDVYKRQIVCWLKTPVEFGGRERYQNTILFHRRFLPLLQRRPLNELKMCIRDRFRRAAI